ncbi:unnamed protein product [Alopecurus aequalis]
MSAQAMSSAAATGDMMLTKVFVGGLAWETHKEGVRGYFERFGEILEAVVIFDKNTGRSKGYGFVTFREAEAAMRACLDPYPVIDGRRANCNLAYLGVHRSKQPQLSPHLQPYLPAVGHVHGGGNMNMRAMKAAAVAGGASFVDHGIQQGIPAYNMYSPYFSDYSYQPMLVRNFYTYYQAYGGLDGAAQYQVYNGNGGASPTVPAAGLTLADPTGFYNPYYPYTPVSPTAAYSMMQYPQMYPYAAVGASPESSPATVSTGLHKFLGAMAFEPSNRGQAAGVTMSMAAPALSAPPTPQYQYRLVSSKPVAAPDEKKPLA